MNESMPTSPYAVNVPSPKRQMHEEDKQQVIPFCEKDVEKFVSSRLVQTRIKVIYNQIYFKRL